MRLMPFLLMALLLGPVYAAPVKPSDRRPVTRTDTAATIDRLQHIVHAHQATIARRTDVQAETQQVQSLLEATRATASRVSRLEAQVRRDGVTGR